MTKFGTRARRRALAVSLLVLLAFGQAPPRAFADERDTTRPRRVEAPRPAPARDDILIRVALMTDVASLAISSADNIEVRGADQEAALRPAANQPIRQVRVEVRRQPPKSSTPSTVTASRESSPSRRPMRTEEVIARAPSKKAPPAETIPQLVALDHNRTLAADPATLILAPQPSNLDAKPARVPALRVGTREYRGEIHLVMNARGRFNVVNVLPIEDYLRGVVPLELSPGSFGEIEALKAQAVAARTYALANRGRFAAEGYDLRDDTRSQVYGGLSAEHPLTNRAIEETRGIVALHADASGKLTPIEALYMSTCGGHTENNEAIFLTDPVPYLRGVACVADARRMARDEIATSRRVEALAGFDNRSLSRDVAALQVLGFELPRRLTGDYLRASVERDELRRWAERLARLTGRGSFLMPRGDVARLPAFAMLLASALLGEGRGRVLLTEADIDYFLDGLGLENAPKEARPDLAMLVKEGILRLPADGESRARAVVTRALAIETIARAMTATAKFPATGFRTQTLREIASGRLIFNEPKPAARRGETANRNDGLAIENDAWLFRRVGTDSYPVRRLRLVGGERLTFHVNQAGRIDFLEVEANVRGAASDRYSNATFWNERMSAEELRVRLARWRVRVGELEDLVPISYGASNRVTELEVIGKEGRARLRGGQVRSALGLKDSLFYVERLRENGRTVAFEFTGRGWGHGIGLCQTGAYGLARAGYSYQAILRKYYTGVRIERFY